MTSCVIIDDELKARDNLRNLIVRFCPDLSLIGEAFNVATGLKLIKAKEPQIVFLDVEMPDGTGFDLLDHLENKDHLKVIFVTGFDHFAAKAFRYAAIDYLLKPPDPDQLIEAVKKTQSNDYFSEISKKLDVIAANRNGFNKIAIPFMKGIQMIDIEEIIYCESDCNYTRFYLESEKNILATKILKEYDELLTERSFIRIHRSFLVNIKKIERYIEGQGGSVILTNGKQLEVSKRKKKELIEALMLKHS